MKNLHANFVFLLLGLFLVDNVFSQCPSGMISYWKLQESTGTTFRDEKEAHNALGASSSPSQTQGISGKAQIFNSSSYLSVPSHADFNWTGTGSFSLELWVNYSGTGSTEVFIGRDDPVTQAHWWIGRTSTGTIEWFTRASDGSNGDIETSGSFNNGQWHYVVAVRDGSASKNYLYVDGVLQNAGGTMVSLSGNLSSTADITIGNLINNNVPEYFFSGALDEIAVYNRALISSEITAHYNNARLYQIGYCDGDNPVLLSKPIIYATVGQQYTYDVDASGNSTPVYSLIEKPAGMAIDQVTGVITWTPSSAGQLGHVVLRATNNKGFVEQTFNINIAEAPSCRNNLIAYWNFDEIGSAPYFDNIAGYKLTGIGATHGSGKVKSALSFDGVNDSLNMKDIVEPAKIFFDFDNVASFSIELWMKSSATPSQTMVMVGRDQITNGTQYWVGVNPAGTVGYYLSDYPSPPNTAYIEGGSVLDGAWHHIVATYNATSNDMKLFVDKIMVSEKNQNFLNFGGDADLNIGYLNTPIDKFWYEGLIDELAIYNTELTDTKITSDYNDGILGIGACIYNYAPVILSSPDTVVDQNSPYYYKLISTDINSNDVNNISVVTKPAWLTFTYVATDTFAILSGTPGNGDVGFHDVKLRVSDGTINVDQTFKIHVKNINDPPLFTSSPIISINQDATYSYTLVATDPDSDPLTYSAPVLPEWLTLDPTTHILSGIPTNSDVGISDITVRVTDGTVAVDQTYQLTVNNVNDLPEITSDPILTVHANETYMYEIKATDKDAGDVLTFSADSKPGWLTFTAGSTSGILVGIPAEADMGTHAIILKVSDGHGETMQGFTLTVTGPSGINDIDNSIIQRVYPNPATDKVYFRLAEPGKARVEIYDVSGNLKMKVNSENEKVFEINISDLSKGIYLFKVYQNDKLSVGKISKN